MDAVTAVPRPVNEPVLGYGPGSGERSVLQARLAGMAGAPPLALDALIGGVRRPGSGGDTFEVRMPSDHAHVLGTVQQADGADAEAAIAAALESAPAWAALPFDQKAAIFLRAADLIAGPHRATMNAATASNTIVPPDGVSAT